MGQYYNHTAHNVGKSTPHRRTKEWEARVEDPAFLPPPSLPPNICASLQIESEVSLEPQSYAVGWPVARATLQARGLDTSLGGVYRYADMSGELQ